MTRMPVQSSPIDTSPEASGFSPSMLASVTYRVLLTVQDGVHSGAAQVAQPGDGILVGSDPSCHLVLMDDGVAPRALQVLEHDGQLVAEVLDHGIVSAGRELPLGPHTFPLPQITLCVGSAVLQVELLRRTRRTGLDAGPAGASGAQRHRPPPMPRSGRPWLSLTLAGLGFAALLAVAGGAVNASSSNGLPPAQRQGPGPGAVLAHFNALGAQLLLATPEGEPPTVQGLVSDAGMRQELEQALQSTGSRLALQVHDVKQMAESLTRLARLGGYTCGARHLGDGRFACDVPVPDEVAAARLQALVPSVPGVQSLAVRVAPPQALVQVPAAAAHTATAR